MSGVMKITFEKGTSSHEVLRAFGRRAEDGHEGTITGWLHAGEDVGRAYSFGTIDTEWSAIRLAAAVNFLFEHPRVCIVYLLTLERVSVTP